MASELLLAPILCLQLLGGASEVTHHYDVVGETRRITIDCETATHVIEVGLDDRRSSFDSVHQAVFAAEKTGKQPMVVILDTNGIEEAAEYQVETVARRLGIDYVVYDADFLLRWQMTQLFRERRDALLAQTSGAVPLN